MANIYDILIVYKRWARWKWFCGLALAFILDKCNLEKVEEILDIVALNKMELDFKYCNLEQKGIFFR